MHKDTLNSTELAAILQLSPHSIHPTLSRNPDRLPQPIRRPNTKRLIWLRADVIAWLEAFKDTPVRKRGRPTKTEQMKRTNGGAR